MTQLTGAFSKQSILYYNFAVRRRSRAQVQHLASLALLSSPVAAHLVGSRLYGARTEGRQVGRWSSLFRRDGVPAGISNFKCSLD